MSILTPEYIKEQAHKPCFWSEEYGFDVVAFTLAMEQAYSNRVGSKINELKKAIAKLEAENARLREELRKVSEAINDPECDLTKTMVECITAAQADAARYRWLRSPVRGMGGLSSVINDDCNPPFYELKFGEGLDAAIDNAIKEVGHE